MDNVLKALKHMAEHGGYWGSGTYAGVWCFLLRYARSYSETMTGFTQDEMQAFLRHYEKVLSFARSYDPNYKEV